MVFYHGSKQIIDHPAVRGSDPRNDYGPSFYLTLDLAAAKSWACKNDALGYVNRYIVRNGIFESLRILDLTDKSTYSILNWMAILLHFRELDRSFITKNQEAISWLARYYVDVSEYDVVIGFRADDSYFRFPKEFINGNLAFEDLEGIYMLGNLGIQYAFMSERAVSSLQFADATSCEESFMGKHYEAVQEASRKLDEVLQLPKASSKTYILDLIRRGDGQR